MRLEAYGTIDELNSWLGLIRSVTDDTEVKDLLYAVQSNLFICGSKLASDEKGKQISGNLNITREEILRLENAIDAFDMELDPLQSFILPGVPLLWGIVTSPGQYADGPNGESSNWQKPRKSTMLSFAMLTGSLTFFSYCPEKLAVTLASRKCPGNRWKQRINLRFPANCLCMFSFLNERLK